MIKPYMLMETKRKELDEAPETRVLELCYEGVVCMSGDFGNPDVGNTNA